jgi:hypothetical protein
MILLILKFRTGKSKDRKADQWLLRAEQRTIGGRGVGARGLKAKGYKISF